MFTSWHKSILLVVVFFGGLFLGFYCLLMFEMPEISIYPIIQQGYQSRPMVAQVHCYQSRPMVA